MPTRTYITCCRNWLLSSQSVTSFLQQGGRALDTAPVYRSGELVMAEGIRASGVPREELWLSTKIDSVLWPLHLSPKAFALESLRKSMERLGVSYLDIAYLHWGPMQAALQGDSMSAEDYVEMWRGLQEAKRAGLVRTLGVCESSRSDIESLIRLTGEAPAVALAWFNPWVPPEQFAYVDWLKSQGIAVVAYGVFNFKYPAFPLSEERVQAASIAGRNHGATWGQLVMQWALDQGLAIMTPLYHPEYIREDLPCTGFSVTAQDRQLLDAVPKNSCDVGRDNDQYYPGCLPDQTAASLQQEVREPRSSPLRTVAVSAGGVDQ